MARYCFFFLAEDGIRVHALSRGLGEVYKGQISAGLERELDVLRNPSLATTQSLGKIASIPCEPPNPQVGDVSLVAKCQMTWNFDDRQNSLQTFST